MAEVFLCATGQLTAASRTGLRKAGVVVVEVDDPSKCQFIRSSEAVSSDDMLWAVLDALNVSGKYSDSGAMQREQLARNLLKVVTDARSPLPS